jgi:adenylyltransferase/sulfurtransferase
VNYRDLFPSPPSPDLVPNCAEGGVLGVLPGIVGSLQASEVIKVLADVGEPLAGRLFIFDAASFTTRVLKVSKNPNYQPITKLIDYDMFCGVKKHGAEQPATDNITVYDLQKMMSENVDFQLVDVREPYEYDIANLGGDLIPLIILSENTEKISKNKQVVVHCKSGARSAKAVAILHDLGFTNILNLQGGILEYADKIDHSLTKY